MKKSMKILLALVLVLAVAGGGVLYTLGPSLKLGSMMKEAYSTPDTDFTLTLHTPENDLWLEGSRLTTAGQAEVGFYTPGDHQALLTRVVVDGQTAYLDFWPLVDVLGQAFFDFIEVENPLGEIPDGLRRSGVVALQLSGQSEERQQARTTILTAVKDSFMPELMDEAKVERADGGVTVTWEPEKLAAVLTQAGERLKGQDRALYMAWTDLLRSWGQELNSQSNLVTRMMGKLLLGMAQSREKNQAQGVADLHDRMAEGCAALADQAQQYGSPELHVWETDYSIAQQLKWTGPEGESRIFLEVSPSEKTGVELPGAAENQN